MTDTVPYYEDFAEIKKKIWSMLDNAVKDRGSPFRIPVFICGDQSDFDGRIVVLRKSDQLNNLVQYHSDIRSDKIEKLKANKNAAMLFYDKDEKINKILEKNKIWDLSLIDGDNVKTEVEKSKTEKPKFLLKKLLKQGTGVKILTSVKIFQCGICKQEVVIYLIAF